MDRTEVLIAGAGPTGLVLALWLTRLGIHVRIVDKLAEPGTTSRAVAVQARTLEFYAQLGLADTIVERGRRAGAANLWVSRRRIAHLVLGDMGAGISPFPYALIYPQDEHERLLIECLAALNVQVERETELVSLEETGDGVVAQLRHADGRTTDCLASFAAGCDGAHSVVREQLSIPFAGGTYEHLFYVADVEAEGPALNGEVHVALDATDFIAVFPLNADRRARLVGTIRDPNAKPASDWSWDDVGHQVIAWMDINVTRVRWFSTYRVHHRVAARFRSGRAFLLGDAAHIHSPVGGQGMNTGIGDAVNLGWKLAAVLRRAADPAILGTYETERIAFARRLVATTDQAFTAVTSSTWLARTLRLHVVPRLLPWLTAFAAVRRLLFRTVSQTSIEYRGSWLSDGRADSVQGGDRLPFADNFVPLTALAWQAHVYGDATPAIHALCAERRIPLHVFEWKPAMRRAGLRRHAFYLIRPDGYIGLAAVEQRPAIVAAYLDSRALRPALA